jgi:hypothetical protein
MKLIEKRHKDKPFVHYTFDSLAELADHVQDLSIDYDRASMENPQSSWAGCDFPTAVSKAQTGDPLLAEKLAHKVDAVESLLDSEGVEIIRDVVGDFFDIGTVLSGEPECWWREEMAPQRDTIRIESNFVLSANISEDMLMNRGGAIVALCDSLADAGYGVDLRMVAGIEYRRQYFMVDVGVSCKPLDIDSVAFCLAHPATLRRLIFGLMEKHYNKTNCGDGYGRPTNYLNADSKRDKEGIHFVSNTNTAFSKSNFYDVEDAEKHVVRMIEKYNELSKENKPLFLEG